VKSGCSKAYVYLADAAALLRHVSVLFVGLVVCSRDADANFTRRTRRFAYCALAMCCTVESVASVVWGNALAVGVDLALGSFNFILDTQITSCTYSQALISLYFAIVSLRSDNGRAWAYAPLRFELKAFEGRDEASSGISALLVSQQAHEPTAADSALSRMRRRLLMFQRRQFVKCRVFFIPCAVSAPGVEVGSDAEAELVRPLFGIKGLRPLHRLADAHPLWYLAAVVLLIFSSVASVVLQGANIISGSDGGIASLALNTSALVGLIGFMSCRSQNIDKSAAKHIALSFRYIYCAVLYACWIALDGREAVMGTRSPWQVSSRAVGSLLFFLCIMLDCSTRLSAVAQFLLSVMRAGIL
jgi:hypothetical protein